MLVEMGTKDCVAQVALSLKGLKVIVPQVIHVLSVFQYLVIQIVKMKEVLLIRLLC
jgi:hypothetical protein